MKYIKGPVICDLRLHDGVQVFHIDALLITENRLIILEVKNFKGELVFDFDNRRILWNSEGRTNVFPNRFIQIVLQNKVRLFSYHFGRKVRPSDVRSS